MSWQRCVLSLLSLLYAGLAAAVLDEQPALDLLEYEARYQGPLTANSSIPIARIFLQSREISLPSVTQPLFETSMRVSSGLFSFVEDSFPFRVRYRSLYQIQPMTLLALEKYKLTDRLKHELTWVDSKSGRVGRYRQQAGGAGLPAILNNWLDADGLFSFYKPARHKALPGLVDRLAMLQSLRVMQMKPGAEYSFDVTDGKRLLDYRVKVLGQEQVHNAGKTWPVWKLMLNGFATKKGVTSARHAPIYLWMSKDRPGLPLRFLHDHPMGAFTLELQGTGG